MTPKQWKEFLPYFTPKECGEEMNREFMLNVLELRLYLGVPMHIHAGVSRSGHAPNSYHHSGQALDFHCNNISPRRVLAAIDRIGKFGGAGYYPWWNNDGFHIDNRPMEQYQRWLSQAEGKYHYLIS